MTIYIVTTKSPNYAMGDTHLSFNNETEAIQEAVEMASGSGNYLDGVKLDSIYEVDLTNRRVTEQELELENGRFKLKKRTVK